MSLAHERELPILLTLEQSGLILQALAELPFKTVFELIGQLNQQAHRLFADGVDPQSPQPFVFAARDLSLAIKALGELPFNRVSALLSNLHQQIAQQKVETGHGGI